MPLKFTAKCLQLEDAKFVEFYFIFYLETFHLKALYYARSASIEGRSMETLHRKASNEDSSSTSSQKAFNAAARSSRASRVSVKSFTFWCVLIIFYEHVQRRSYSWQNIFWRPSFRQITNVEIVFFQRTALLGGVLQPNAIRSSICSSGLPDADSESWKSLCDHERSWKSRRSCESEQFQKNPLHYNPPVTVQ